jgi:type IV pilus assembly protein PilX
MHHRPQHSRRQAQRGVSLIITLIMLVIIGLTAAAAMRSAVSSEKVINNMRAEALAQQYAEVALRYCEQQMELASAGRPASLQDTAITTTAAGATPTWQLTTTWTGGATKMTTIPEAQIKSGDSSFVPTSAPQCFVERQTLADGSNAVVVTARGFSPDYQADGNGNTVAGSVVWLQSTSAFN